MPTTQDNSTTPASVVESPETSALAALATVVDDLQKRNAALEAESRRLECMVQYRSRFLARLVHELRTPLTSILGFAEILISQEQLTEAQTCFCQKIQHSALQLQANLTQLADLSRLEAGQTEVFLEEFSLDEVLRESCTAVARPAQKHSVVVKWAPDGNLPSIVSDRSKLRHVLYNFLTYAISRSPEGGLVTLAASRSDREFVVTIEDEGEPVSDPSQTVMVGEFAPDSHLAGGSELGLAIARQLIKVLDAKVDFENRQRRGLQVTIHLTSRSALGRSDSVSL